MKSKSLEVRLKAATALATFAYNNTNQQCSIRLAGGVRMDCFNDFLEAENEDYQAYAAFQIIILARVISDVDQVSASAQQKCYLSYSQTFFSSNLIPRCAQLVCNDRF